MMDYEVFKEVVKLNFLNHMPKQYRGMEVRVDSQKKINQKMDGLSLHPEGSIGISPIIYISDMYKDYIATGDLEETLQKAAAALDRAFKQKELPPLDKSKAKDNIIFQLVNTAQNEDMLCNMPHREFQDLSIIYRWVVEIDDKCIMNTMINNSLAQELGMDEEQLFKFAAENTRRILPPTVKPMNEVMREIFLADGMPPSMVDIMFQEMPQEQIMWVISNERGINGAASMLYEDKLHRLAEDVESDLYIMPSSVHEVIAVSVEMGDPIELAQMVAEVNMDQVELGDRLSNQVYLYDRDLRKITLATDTPNKRLDGVVEEQGHVYEAKPFR